MSYTPEMRASLAKVEASRPRRLKETYPRLSPEERQTVLKKFHPDYIETAFREIRVGPNKGGRTLNELADLLEGRSRIDPNAFDLSRVDYETDVLIIGGGGAGTAAALLAHEGGAKVILATKLRLGDANTMMAQGGIQAADKENDSPATHYLDVMGGGGFANVPALVEALVMDAPIVIQWLENLGCMFEKEPNGTMKTIHGGGTSRKRMHFARDYSGAEIMRTLRDEVRSRDITVLEFAPAIELVTDDKGRVVGAILMNLETGYLMLVRAKAVIIATGGGGRLHYQDFPTTNHYGATADGLVLAYRVGAKLAFIDTMQYHPTGAAYPEQILGQLVTEKVRGLGAQVVNVDGEQFVYPLETRDVESAVFIRECVERSKCIVTPSGQSGVWLDSPMIDILRGEGTIQKELPAMVRQYKRFGIDMTKEPILVYPTLHYQNGGVAIQPDGSTEVAGLFVAGEAAGGIHGRNRLMGNSLLDITVFGRRAGKAAAEYAKSVNPGSLTLAHLQEWNRQLTAAGLEPTSVSPLILPDYTRHDQIHAAALVVPWPDHRLITRAS
jgi:succinate dehydrogenase / fumarate reductase flavoprotein subunit